MKYCFFIIFFYISINNLSAQTYYPCSHDTIEIAHASTIFMTEGDTIFIEFTNVKTCYFDSNLVGWYLDLATCQNLGNFQFVPIHQEGIYFLSTPDQQYDCTNRQVYVNFLDNDYFSIGNNYVIENDSIVILYGPDHFHSYVWSTGETDSQIDVDNSGIYSIIGQNHCGVEFYDTLEIINEMDNSSFYAGLQNSSYSDQEITPIINYPFGVDDPHRTSNSILDIDLDQDSIVDLIIVTQTGYAGGGAGTMTIQCTNNYKACVNNGNSKYARVINDYEIIDENLSWSDELIYLRLFTYTDCITYYNEPLWANSQYKYLVFRQSTESDTVYSYVKMKVVEINDIIDYSIIEKANSLFINNLISQNNNSIINIYPNPSKDYVVIINDIDYDCIFELHNLEGRLIKKGIINSNKFILSIEDSMNGMYILKIKLKQENIIKKLIINSY